MEVADLKGALHAAEIETKLLEERVELTEGTVTTAKAEEVAQLKHKMQLLEKNMDKLNREIHSLASSVSHTTSSLATYEQHLLMTEHKLDEIAKLRSTLQALSVQAGSQTYQIKSGDSLEKIARQYHTTPEAIKRENNLFSDKIMVGDKLRIPTE